MKTETEFNIEFYNGEDYEDMFDGYDTRAYAVQSAKAHIVENPHLTARLVRIDRTFLADITCEIVKTAKFRTKKLG